MNVVRRGFTLVEIMVSIMIFTVVGGAMLAILFTATELYRFGEAGRAANDEAVAAMAALDDDLTHLVAAKDGGWIYAEVVPTGNCILAFKVMAQDRSQITSAGVGARQLVVWHVDTNERLRRFVLPEPTHDDDPATDDDLEALLAAFSGTEGVAVTQGCLHFGAWLSTDAQARGLSPNDEAWDPALPGSGGTYSSGPFRGAQPFPHALRITATLTGGGRYAQQGFVIEDSGDHIRLAGIRAVPTVKGAVARIDNEWIRYTGHADGALTGVQRGVRRSTSTPHARGQAVRFGQTYTLVRGLPR